MSNPPHIALGRWLLVAAHQRNTGIEGTNDMATNNTRAATIGFESDLWRAADALHSSMDAAPRRPTEWA